MQLIPRILFGRLIRIHDSFTILSILLRHPVLQIFIVNVGCQHEFLRWRFLKERECSLTQSYPATFNLLIYSACHRYFGGCHFKLECFPSMLLLLVEIEEEGIALAFRIHYHDHVSE